MLDRCTLSYDLLHMLDMSHIRNFLLRSNKRRSYNGMTLTFDNYGRTLGDVLFQRFCIFLCASFDTSTSSAICDFELIAKFARFFIRR